MKIGIDLGTTNTLAAFVNANHTPELIPDHRFNDSFMTPSVVHVAGDTCVVGKSLERISRVNSHVDIARHTREAADGPRHLFTDTGGTSWTSARVSAQVLRKVRQDAEIRLSQGVDAASIAVPSSFNSNERLVIQAAAVMAGFVDVELVDDAVAAAASFGFNRDVKMQTLFVYDLGGGTFDAAVVRSSEDGLTTLATLVSKQVGGRAFDEVLVDELKTVYARQTGKTTLSDGAGGRLLRFAIDAKANLDPRLRPAVQESLLLDGQVIDLCLNYSHLCNFLNPLLEKTLRLSNECIGKAGLEWSQIDRILLTGGSSQLPGLREKLSSISGKRGDEINLYQPHEAIAFGAAILGEGAISVSGMPMSLKPQVAHSDLGIGILDRESNGMAMEPLIQQNASLPKSVKRLFYTNRRQQRELVIQLLRSKTGDDGFERLEDFSIGPIGNESENEPVEIGITLGRDGIVQCEASTAAQSVITIQDIHSRSKALRLEESLLSSLKLY